MIKMTDIVDDNNPLLREKSEEVKIPLSDEDRQLLLDMHEYLRISQDDEANEAYNLRPGVGFAAIQLGVKKRMTAILIYDYDDEGNITHTTSYALANPKIISYSERMAYLTDGEGCLSVNEAHDGLVPRHAKVTITGYDALTDQYVRIIARGYHAIVFQHELDHFDGVLFYDRINQEDPFARIEGALEL